MHSAKDCDTEVSNNEELSTELLLFFFCLSFFNWDSPHGRLNSHYEAWSYKTKSTKKITGYRKSV